MNIIKEKFSVSNNGNEILKIVNCILNFVEKIIPGIMFLLGTVAVFSKKQGYFKLFFEFFSGISTSFLDKVDTIATVATVLVGICFSLYSILLTADGNSILSKISDQIFKKIVKLITSTFLLSIVCMFAPLISVTKNNFGYLYGLLLATVFLFLILRSLRVGIYFYIIINTDLESRLSIIKKDNANKKSMENMIRKLYRAFFNNNKK